MTLSPDQASVSALVKMAETLNDGAQEIVLTRKEATALVGFFARELFGDPKEFYEQMRKAGILR
jgi:hypothetical protein